MGLKSVKLKSCLKYHNDIIKIQWVKIDSSYITSAFFKNGILN